MEIRGFEFMIKGVYYLYVFILFFQHNFCIKPYVPRENPEGTRVIVGSVKMKYIIRHCQDSNSQPVPSQVCADSMHYRPLDIGT